MGIKVAVYAIGASTALLGCAQLASVDQSAGITSSQNCTSSPCGVAVGKKWGIFYDMPDPIVVSTGSSTQITWTLDSAFGSGAYFHPTKGIEFNSEIAQYFPCTPGNPPGMPRTYTCIDNAPKGPYKYTIRTRGSGALGDSDPTVVNN